MSWMKWQWIFFLGRWHFVVAGLTVKPAADQSASANALNIPSLVQEESGSPHSQQQQTLEVTQLQASPRSVELGCHPCRAKADKTQLSDHGIVITASGSRFEEESFFSFLCFFFLFLQTQKY